MYDYRTAEYKTYTETHVQLVKAELDGSPDVEQLEFTETTEFNVAVAAAENYKHV